VLSFFWANVKQALPEKKKSSSRTFFCIRENSLRGIAAVKENQANH